MWVRKVISGVELANGVLQNIGALEPLGSVTNVDGEEELRPITRCTSFIRWLIRRKAELLIKWEYQFTYAHHFIVLIYKQMAVNNTQYIFSFKQLFQQVSQRQ